MSRASYLEFLPDDFDAKSQLAETLKTLMPIQSENDNNPTSSNMNNEENLHDRRSHNHFSRVSFANNDEVFPECNSSDDDDERVFFNSNDSTKFVNFYLFFEANFYYKFFFNKK